MVGPMAMANHSRRKAQASAFARTVYEALEPLHTAGFAPAHIWANARFASLIKRLRENVCAYVFVSDGRAASSDLTVSLWVAPPDSPDDALDRLGVGFKIMIGGECAVDDEFFTICCKRLSLLMTGIHGVADAVQSDLESPCVETHRLRVYRMERRIYGALLALCRDGPRSIGESVAAIASRAVQAGSSVDELEEACVPIAVRLEQSGLLVGDELGFYGGDPRLLGGALFRHIYIDALAPVRRKSK